MQDVKLISYLCGWGAGDKHCKYGPLVLQKFGLDKKLPFEASWAEPYFSKKKVNNNKKRIPIIVDYTDRLCNQVLDAINDKKFPVVLGGDHSMAIGTWGGVTKALDAKQELGLIWIDAHMDAHIPKTSHSGNFHGMPLATLLGKGSKELCAVGGIGTKIRPEHVCLIGVRSYEEEEARLLEELGVRTFFMDEIRERGLKTVLKQALAVVKKDTVGYGVTIDLDVFDPSVAPGTGIHEKDGLLKSEALDSFSIFINDKDLKALEIAEFSPNMDKKNKTSQLILDIIDTILTR